MSFDLAQIRLDNALLLFDEFMQQAARQPDAATLRGLEGRFAERLQIQPSYWSQIKSRSRQIGERLARQFEERMRKPYGWMDAPHGRGAAPVGAPAAPEPAAVDEPELTAQSDDERFIVGLVLTYYRRHPDKARARLLDLLSEVLVAGPAAGKAPAKPPPTVGAGRPGDRGSEAELFRRSQAGVQPLKRRR
jgi:hypothetical protein